MLLAGGYATAQEGVNQTEALIKKGEQTVKAVSEAKLQLEKTLANYNTIVDGKAADPKASYKDLGKAVKDTEDRVAAVDQAEGRDGRGGPGTLFASWKASAGRHQQSRLERREPGQAGQTAGYGKIATAGKDARAVDSFLTGTQGPDHFPGPPLNPAAMASLKPEAAKLNDKAKTMFGRDRCGGGRGQCQHRRDETEVDATTPLPSARGRAGPK